MTPPGAPGTASDGYRTGPVPHTCPAGPDDYGRRPCPCRTTTSLRPVDSDPNRGRRRIPLTFFPASDLLGLNDEPVDSGGRRRDTTNEGDAR